MESDGGNISLVGIEDGKLVRVRLEGACVACSVNQMTLRSGVEMTIKKYAPQIGNCLKRIIIYATNPLGTQKQ